MKLADRLMAAAWLLFIGACFSSGLFMAGHIVLGVIAFGVLPLSFGWSYRGYLTKKESVGNTMMRPFWLIIFVVAWLLFRIAWLAGMMIRRGKYYRRLHIFKQAETPV